MGGLAKGRLPLRGKALIAHVIDRLAPQVPEVMISANGHDYDDLGLHIVADVVSDEMSGRAGPLAGLHAGLIACESPWLVTAPCDAPYLPLDLVDRLALARATSRHCRLFVAESPRGLEPAFLLCHVSLTDELAEWLTAGGRKAQAWLAANSAQTVEFPEVHSFANINTPEDLANHAAIAIPERNR
jgi:molybdopterin-guanine dinucleotide biosynthesis protein A